MSSNLNQYKSWAGKEWSPKWLSTDEIESLLIHRTKICKTDVGTSGMPLDEKLNDIGLPTIPNAAMFSVGNDGGMLIYIPKRDTDGSPLPHVSPEQYWKGLAEEYHNDKCGQCSIKQLNTSRVTDIIWDISAAEVIKAFTNSVWSVVETITGVPWDDWNRKYTRGDRYDFVEKDLENDPVKYASGLFYLPEEVEITEAEASSTPDNIIDLLKKKFSRKPKSFAVMSPFITKKTFVAPDPIDPIIRTMVGDDKPVQNSSETYPADTAKYAKDLKCPDLGD